MLSLVQSSSSPSSSASPANDSSYPSQPSYESSWHSESIYPSPPMSSSPSGTFAGRRGFDQYTGRYVHLPPSAQNPQPWGHPVAYPGGFAPQHQLHHQHQHPHPHAHPHPHQHQAQRSPPAQYSIPPYAIAPQQAGPSNYAYGGQAQTVRGYPTPERAFQSVVQPVQPTTVLGSSTPGKKPQRQQRRTKAQVHTACHNCKKAHLSCQGTLPCNRCVTSGKTETCFAVAHKRRGRPRIRDGIRGQKTGGKVKPSDAEVKTTKVPIAQAKSSLDLAPDSAVSFPGGAPFDTREPPKAFLDSDFTVLKVNQSFRGHFDYEQDPIGRNLEQFIDSSDKNTLTLLRVSLQSERDVRKATAYLFPLKLDNGNDVNEVPSIESLDYTTVSQQNFTVRDSNLRFRFRNNNVQNLTVNLQLAKADQFFIILTLPILQENAAPAPIATNTTTTTTSSLPPTGTFHAPRSVPQLKTDQLKPDTSSYTLPSSTTSFAPSPAVYTTHPAIAPLPQARPNSPYYTLTSVPQPGHVSATSTSADGMTPTRTAYDHTGGYYYAAPVYNYAMHPGQPSDGAIVAANEPRQFPAYAPDSAQLTVQYPTAPNGAHGHGQAQGQHMVPQAFQLPPIFAQHQQQQQQQVERPRSVHHGPQIAYAVPRDHHQQQQGHGYVQGHGHGLPVMRPMHHTAPLPVGGQGMKKEMVQ